MLLATLLVVGLGTSVAAIQRGQYDAQVRGALEQEKLATELSLLKAQINPHFFFNTLNNIYSLTLLDVERARAALHRLSRMMRYVLYETPNGQTHLSQEINFLLDYVELMNLRLTDQVEVVVETPSPQAGELAADPLIAPMLFQPFLENAFKHGVSALVSSRITIALRQPSAQQVELCVRNTLVPPAATYPDEPGGIGLANTRRRLDLLYPGRYQLHITNPTPANEYEVCLSLHLHP
jgi:LytS/YehU family sensor histidine kinase